MHHIFSSQTIDQTLFLKEYWQKKPFLFRNVLPHFANPVSPDELAGLALDDEIESRIVYETPKKKKQWHLQRGPFSEETFQKLPKTHWTLLVQGVDRLIPQVQDLLDCFDFLPPWRIDDIMISYATQFGSVGPHYDNYDVFLFQALGQREWRLSTKNCTPENHIPGLELRIMEEFEVEQQWTLEEGDMLYLPPHIGHYGIAQSEECMTYSFGYRSYQGQELLESLCDFSAEHAAFKTLYRDPDWSTSTTESAKIPKAAWRNAQTLLQQLIHNEELMKSWFSCFVTRLDQQAEQQFIALNDEPRKHLNAFLDTLHRTPAFMRDPYCRFAYTINDDKNTVSFYANGSEWDVAEVSVDLIKKVAQQRCLDSTELHPFLQQSPNKMFLFQLWTMHYLHCID